MTETDDDSDSRDVLCPFIEPITANDLSEKPSYKQLFVSSFQELDRKLGAKVRSAEELGGVFDYTCKDPGTKVLAIFGDGGIDDPLGFVTYNDMEASQGIYVSQLVVHERYWRHGLGTRLIAQLAINQPRGTALHGIVRANNEISQNFFAGLEAKEWEDKTQWPEAYLKYYRDQPQSDITDSTYVGFKVDPACFG